MTRRLLSVLTFIFLVPAFAATTGLSQPSVSADHGDTDEQTGEQVLTGHPRIDYDGAVLTADQIRYNRKTNVAVARGNVVLTRDAQRFLADEITYRFSEKTFSVVRMRLGEHPFYVSGDQVTGIGNDITIKNAIASYHEPHPFAPTLTAESLVFTSGDKIRATDARIGLGQRVPLVPLGRFEQGVNTPLISQMSARFGQSGSLGLFADVGMHVPVYPGVSAGGDVGYYTKRGLLFGPSGTFDFSSSTRHDAGSLKTGYINDRGDRTTDILNQPISEDRSYIDWQSRHRDFASNTTVTTQLSYWSDSAIVRDFRPGDFYNVQQPDTFLDAATARDNFVVSLFLRAQPNSYYAVQRRLPELRFDLLPTPIGLGLYERFNASAVSLHEHQFTVPDGTFLDGPTVKSNRLDAFYSLTRPIAPTEWLNLSPVVGGRLTHYLDATGGRENYTRALGELGFDASLRASGIYAYRNERWGIDGIRHLVTPKLSYRYIPSADKGRAYIPEIDRTVFDTTLPTLELGDQRAIDDLRATNTLRLGLDNTFQTRDKTYGSRDLLIFNLAQDFRFRRDPGEKDFSEIHAGVSFMPARWMRLDIYNSFAPQTFTLREHNTRFSIYDGDAWSLSLSNHYLQDQIEEYIAEGRYRINEAYQTVLRLHYDSRQSRFVERSLAVRQNIDNLWSIEYGLTWYQGRERDDGFSPSISVRLTGF